MAKPVILAVRGESQRLVEEAGAGVCIGPESALQLAATVRRLKADPAALKAMGEAGRRYVTAHFDRRALALRFEELLRNVVTARGALRANSSRN